MLDYISATGTLDEDGFQKAILAYKNTPDPSTGVLPAIMLFR